MNVSVKTTIETRIMDAKTGKPVKTQKKDNLILDSGLNAMARSNTLGLACFPATASNVCLIGGGTNPNSIASGAVTFTQSGTTITASGSFFTSAMVGCIFKYGTGSGGAEYYITAFTNATTVTVDTSATVASPTVATVWFVQQTTLQTFLFASSTYQTNTGDCGSTISGNQVTHKRTYVFAQQGSPYTVNEIGYASSLVSNRVLGRVVLGSSDVVGTTNFYVVVISITVTYSPSTPLAVTNVGTNINTAGTLMIEGMNCTVVTSTGGTAANPGSAPSTILDNTGTLMFKTATYTQNGTINSSSGASAASRLDAGSGSWVNDNTRVGSATLSTTSSFSTTGQTLYGFGFRDTNVVGLWLDVLFTTPQTAPTGTFIPSSVWRLTYTRTLVN
jgi:hypothetical protein